MLMVERMILGDDTGLGKTLQVLSTIGYIWMKEPEYVPIVFTKKSALFQWADETSRFMHNMEAVTVDGEPYERQVIYEDFFLNHDPSKKKLLILTYDMVLRDAGESVVRDKSQKPDKNIVKQLKDLRKSLKESAVLLDATRDQFRRKFGELPYEASEYLRAVLAGSAPSRDLPAPLTQGDMEFVQKLITLRDSQKAGDAEIVRLGDIVAPPKKTPGFLSYLRELKNRQPEVKFMLVMDEQHVLKNHRGRIHQTVAEISSECDRIIGMTATAVKNRLMEFFSLFRIVRPGLMPTIKKFHDDFCVVKLQPIGGGRKVPIVVGYKHLDKFVELIEPYYLSRRKHEVAKELPQLVSRELRCELSDVQQELYDLAEVGLLETGSQADANESEMLKAMTLVQQAVDSPALIADENGNPFDGPSCKIDALLELLEDELDGIKVIIFSKFEKMISLIEKALAKQKIRTVRITGKENKASDREKAKKVFQDVKSGVNVILITMAGAESINLHAAEHLIFVDSPWSWGDYVQITGRPIRIGSLHLMVVATHLVAVKKGGGKTIDDHVIKTLKGKKALADKVAGESLKGGLQFVQGNDVADIFQLIRGEHKDKKTLLDEVNKKIASASRRSKPSKKVANTPVEVDMPIRADDAETIVIHTIDLSDI